MILSNQANKQIDKQVCMDHSHTTIISLVVQAHTDASLRRFLRAFIDVDVAFKQLLKCNKWRREYKVATLSPEDPDVAEEMATGKVHILRNRDNKGRYVDHLFCCDL